MGPRARGYKEEPAPVAGDPVSHVKIILYTLVFLGSSRAPSILHFDSSAPHSSCFGSAASRSRPAGGRCPSPVTYMKELAVCCPIRNTWYARICRDTTAARFLVKDKGKVVLLDLDPITPVLRFFKLFTSTEIFKLTSTYPFPVNTLCGATSTLARFVPRSSLLPPHFPQ